MNKDEIAEVRATAKAMREEGYQIAAGTIDRSADALTTLSARVEMLESLLDRMCDAYKLVCDDSGMRYYQSPGSLYAHSRQALGGDNG